MIDPTNKRNVQVQKIVVVKFRNILAQQKPNKRDGASNRFADVEQVLDEILSSDRLNCA